MASPVVGGVYYVADSELTLPPESQRTVHNARRPVLVFSGPRTNSDSAWNFVLVAPISTAPGHRTSFCVQLAAGEGNLPKRGWIRTVAVQPLVKSQLQDFTGIIPGVKLQEAQARLIDYMGLADDE